ncbi:hypothetical protein BpHYR1_027402 [Brachionus plicatilis]|uniref:Uncharacterized protein n=1 Tax=Brachionus plicatilis TaxID=10195 RepID=A0A3M7Q3N9_BRAPC|nr:hypothetical protein BpHYR1_027402 [Brachionus plicatilis]
MILYLKKKPRMRKKRQFKDRRTITNPVDKQDKSLNENYHNLHGNQDNVEFNCPVPDVQPTKNKSFLDSRSDTETESESSGDQTFIPNKYLPNQVVNREGNTRKSSRVKKPSSIKIQETSTMVQHIEHQLDDTVEVEWLNEHRSPSSVTTTFAFLRLRDPREHQKIVEFLDGRDHRNRQLWIDNWRQLSWTTNNYEQESINLRKRMPSCVVKQRRKNHKSVESALRSIQVSAG